MICTSWYIQEDIYEPNELGDVLVITGQEPSNCPDCHQLMRPHGRCLRYVFFPAQERTKLLLRVFFCPECRRYHRELPDFIVPHKMHCVETVEQCYSLPIDEVISSIEESTIRRIRKWAKLFLSVAILVLKIDIQPKHNPFCILNHTDPHIIKTCVNMIAGANKWSSLDRMVL